MVEFIHNLNSSETSTNYINLTDESGRKYGWEIGKADAIVLIVDSRGRQSRMKRHHGNQFTRCSDWFSNNRSISSIRIKHDPLERIGGLKVVYLLDDSLGHDKEMTVVTPGIDEFFVDKASDQKAISLPLERQLEDCKEKDS